MRTGPWRAACGAALAVAAAALLLAPGPAVALPPPVRPVAPGAAPAAEETPAPPPVRPGPPVVPQVGTGELVPVGRDRPATVEQGGEIRYRVEVEGGLPVPTAGFAAVVHQILTDDRGWQALDGVRLVQVADPDADLTVTLASPDTTDRLCAPLRTRGEVSCWNGERAVLNARRWLLGAETFGADIAGYRAYLVSHEVGHGLGHGHRRCPAPGLPAPVMVQQTKSLEGCVANSWPAGG